MCNILKMADHRVKQMKSWGLRCYVLCYVDTFHAWFFGDQLRSFSALCKIPDVKTFKRLLLMLLPIFTFNFNGTLEKACTL